jgi:hypothetical protein
MKHFWFLSLQKAQNFVSDRRKLFILTVFLALTGNELENNK